MRTGDADIPRLYREARQRITELVSGLDPATLDTGVPACPGWSVRDVVAHLTATAEDAVAGRLSGPPTEDQTAAQVARFRGRDMADVLALWAGAAAQLERRLRSWPAVADVISHEHDIRGAVGRPGARDSDGVRQCAERLLATLRPPVPLRVIVEDAEFTVGPAGDAELVLDTTRFEAVRWRMGRRSRDQLAAMAFSGDPAPVLDCLTVFGPAAGPIIE